MNILSRCLARRRSAVLAIVASVAMTACRSSAPVITAHTIDGNPLLRGEYLQMCYDPGAWMRLTGETYLGYVILRARIGPDGLLSEPRLIKYYPDESRNDFAMRQAVLLHVSPTRPQDRKPEAEVYVVFYKKVRPPILSVTWGVEVDPREPPLECMCIKAEY